VLQAGTSFTIGEFRALDCFLRREAMFKSLAGCLVLVVEDQPLIALDVANSFKKAGAHVVISRTLEDAMEKAELEGLSAAVIDHALHDGLTTSDVCAKLKERNVPFIVYSGYDKLDGACASGELVPKPATPHMLLTALRGVLSRQQPIKH
jgi:DNA-binding response OmpR family regulator